MNTSRAILARAIFTTATLAPRLMTAVVRAGHDHPAAAIDNLKTAQLHARSLLTMLQLAELELVAAQLRENRPAAINAALADAADAIAPARSS